MGVSVKTKYNIGDRVWFISNNQAMSMEITGVCATVMSPEIVEVKYTLHFDSSWIDEGMLFRSKEELIESL